jgi:hypothetical protein
MASSQANLEKMHLRQSYRNLWHTDIMGTMQADFPCMQSPLLALFISSPLPHLSRCVIWSPAGEFVS